MPVDILIKPGECLVTDSDTGEPVPGLDRIISITVSADQPGRVTLELVANEIRLEDMEPDMLVPPPALVTPFWEAAKYTRDQIDKFAAEIGWDTERQQRDREVGRVAAGERLEVTPSQAIFESLPEPLFPEPQEGDWSEEDKIRFMRVAEDSLMLGRCERCENPEHAMTVPGFPGVFARVIANQLDDPDGVMRCDMCERYPDDDDARVALEQHLEQCREVASVKAGIEAWLVANGDSSGPHAQAARDAEAVAREHNTAIFERLFEGSEEPEPVATVQGPSGYVEFTENCLYELSSMNGKAPVGGYEGIRSKAGERLVCTAMQLDEAAGLWQLESRRDDSVYVYSGIPNKCVRVFSTTGRLDR